MKEAAEQADRDLFVQTCEAAKPQIYPLIDSRCVWCQPKTTDPFFDGV